MRIILALLLSAFCTQAAQVIINVGTSANDRTGDTLRDAFIKVNTNFTYVFNNLSTTTGQANSNLSYQIGLAATNYSDAIAVALSNLCYSIGAAATNFAVSTTNGILPANAAGVLTNNGSGTKGWLALASIGGSGSGGTNYPPVISNGGGQAASTNITVGLGVRQSIVIITNASFKLVFTGTPNNGESLKVTVSNLNTTANIFPTNTIKYSSVGSNITIWPAVMSNSFTIYTLFAETNLNTGTVEWVLESANGKQAELAVGSAGNNGFLALSTNFNANTVTVTNTYIPQNSSMVTSNMAGLGSLAFTNEFTHTATTVVGAGSGSTNYLLTISTNNINDFYLGSSNINIYTVAGGTLASPIYWNAIVTNLSANTWGISFPSGTNRWRFAGALGTNMPCGGVLSNNLCLMLSGRSDGTNTLVGWTTFVPGL